MADKEIGDLTDGVVPQAGDLAHIVRSGNSRKVALGAAAGKAVGTGSGEVAAGDHSHTKLDYLTVTQAVDLDAIETRVNALDAAVVLKGTWDASAGTFPGSGSAQAGESWIVSVAGTVNSVAFAIGDRIIAITDNASTNTFAANWFKADYTDAVSSVDGATGAVTVGAIIAAASAKTTPVDADMFGIADSAASNATKKVTLANLKTIFGALYQPLAAALTSLASAWIPASASGPAALAFAEDTDNGAHAVSVKAPASLAASVDVVLPGEAGTLAVIIDEDNMASDSATKVPSQQSVKAYADALIAANDAMVFKGVIDCSSNPNYPAADRGHTYRVSVAGKIGGGSGPNVEAGDILLCLTDSTASGNHATVGTAWSIIQVNLDGALVSGGNAGTPSAINLTNGTALPVAGIAASTSTALGVGSLELGHASDTTLSRGAAGFLAVESKRVPSPASQAAGDLLYRGSTEWERLAKGAALQVLRQNSALTSPEWATAREVLTANRTYYVRTDGSDSNTGLVNNSGGAFLTIQKAIDTVASLDCGIYTPTIQVGAGTYTAANTLKSILATEAIIIGDETTPANVLISTTSANCFIAAGVAGTWNLRGLKLQTTTAGVGILAANGSVVRIQNINFGACAFFHMQLYGYASINASGNYSITGGALYHLLAYSAFFGAYARTITLTGTPAWGTAGFECAQAGVVDLRTVTFSGSATGKRYQVASGGVIDTGGGGGSFIPGNSAGSGGTTTGAGFYV